MRALTVRPGRRDSATVTDLDDPEPAAGELLVAGLEVGVCGTDREIVGGEYGWPPSGRERLILGHESLGRVVQAGGDFADNDLVAGVVRRPDPVPCGACERGEFDMCRNGRYTERGIKELDGFAAQLWTIDPRYAVRLEPELADVGVLMEPTSVVAKAWQQVDAVGGRSWFAPQRVLVTGAGPIGLLSALAAAERDLDVHVVDLMERGAKPDAVRALGAEYHSRPVAEVCRQLRPDVVIETTGAGQVILAAMAGTAAYGVVCLVGISSGGHRIDADVAATGGEIVLENDVVIGSVNANQSHYAAAARILAAADTDWLRRLITRRVPLDDFEEAMRPGDDDIKVALTLT